MPPSFAAAGAIAAFVGVFALATLRGVHLGVAMFVAACAVGTAIAGMTLREVIAGFPVGILILVAGVTYFFGIAQLNGTIDRVMGALLARTDGRRALVPVLFFGLAAVMAAMGSPQAGLATGPVGMSAARRARVDGVLMAIAINSGICAGSFAPTSLFGVITYRVAREAGIDITTVALLVVAVVANVGLFAVAWGLFSSAPPPSPNRPGAADITEASTVAPTPAAGGRPMTMHQAATLTCIVGLVPGIIGGTLAGFEVDIGVVLLSLGALLALIDPAVGARGSRASTGPLPSSSVASSPTSPCCRNWTR